MLEVSDAGEEGTVFVALETAVGTGGREVFTEDHKG
jgi:hypothetical protein